MTILPRLRFPTNLRTVGPSSRTLAVHAKELTSDASLSELLSATENLERVLHVTNF